MKNTKTMSQILKLQRQIFDSKNAEVIKKLILQQRDLIETLDDEKEFEVLTKLKNIKYVL